MSENLRSAVVLNNTGDYQIQDSEYAKDGVPQSPVEFSKIEPRLRNQNIESYSPELVMEGYLSTPEGDAALKVIGIVPGLHSSFIPLSSSLTSGSFFKGPESSPVVIGAELAKDFNLKVGDDLVLNYQDKQGGLRSELLTIAGIYNYSSKSFQLQDIYLLQKDWQHLYFGEDTGKILFNRIPLMTNSDHAVSVVKDQSLQLRSWRDENPEMSVAVDFNNLMIRFCVLIVFITAFLTILGPVQILWEERESELKMLTIIGVSKRDMYVLAVIELLIVFILSALFSIVLLGLYFLLYKNGLDLNFLNQGIKLERAGIIIDWLIQPTLNSSNILQTSILVIGVLLTSYLLGVHTIMKKIMKGIA